jgi:uncharacterized protein (TIGR00661 family)
VKILYGVTGEGMGHAIRSRVVLEHLVEQDHEVEIIASGRAVAFLQRHFADVRNIHGLHMIYEDNRVQKSKTLWSNIERGARGLPSNVNEYFKLLGSFSPDVVISDFESWTYLYAKAHRLPIVSIDNMQIINRCKHDKSLLKGHKASFRLVKAFVKAKLPGCNHYLIATFFRPPVRKKRTTLVAPILRREILEAEPERGEHLLVYQTGEGAKTLLETLAKTDIPCRVYGARRDLDSEEVEGNLRYQPFSERKFIDDLASARAVIAGGGFTLMGEAVYLGKPMLAVPLAGQFEQVLNGMYLEREGYGMSAETLDDPKTVHAFLERIDDYAAALAEYEQDGNTELFAALDGLLDRAEAGLL